MPNSLLMQLPLTTGFLSEGTANRPFSDYIAWRVPIDDDVHLSCAVQRLDLDEASAARFFKHKEEQGKAIAALPPAGLIAQQILTGELTLDDVVTREDLVYIQDNVTQIGQGLIADREHEHLGTADSAIILLRKIWQRELKQMATNGTLKDWKVPQHINATSGASWDSPSS
jgi:hypothetical protein